MNWKKSIKFLVVLLFIITILFAYLANIGLHRMFGGEIELVNFNQFDTEQQQSLQSMNIIKVGMMV